MTADPLLSRVHTVLDAQHLWRPAARLVVAVSGGPDSLCLLHALRRLRAAGGPALHVAHLEHGFRGPQSAAEAQFVAQTAHAWDIPATVEHVDVPALLAVTGGNSHAVAREVRYAFLHRVAREVAADAIVTAHHADDQAETVLMHLLHGAGPAGLRGMLVTVAQPTLLLRPLLDVTRREIEQYCADHNLTPQDDPSNTAPHYTRARIRTALLPLLVQYNPQIVTALGRTARICADDYAYIQTELDRLWPALTEPRPAAVYFRAEQWHQLHPALQRYALRRAASQLTGGGELGYEQVEAGRAAASQGAGQQQTLALGLLLRVEHGGFLILASASYADDAATAADYVALPQLVNDGIVLPVPGIIPLSTAWYAEAGYGSLPPGAALPGASEAPRASPGPATQWRWSVILDADRLDGPLLWRRRQPGDRFRPASGCGSRRLQDFMVDAKVPRALRAAWPVLATPTHIVWVAGLRADDRFQATDSTRRIVWVVLKRRRCAE